MIKNLRGKPKLFPCFFRKSLWLSFLFILFSNFTIAQNPVYINTGDYGGLGWNSISGANSLTTGSSWAGNRIILSPSGSGNKYFRFTSATSGWSNYGTTSNCSADVQITGVGVSTSDCDTKAFFLNIANGASNVVFKTTNGAPGTAKVWANEVQGAVRSVTNVTQSPIAASVVPGQNVTVTATLDGALATGQQVYIRYSTDNFTTSTIAAGTVAGTTATFTIPAATNTAAAVVRYYVLTSGSITPTHADADLMTINFNNNSGSNYSYTVNTPGAIYLHNFNTAPSGSSTTYTVAPNTLNANLTTTGWSNAGNFSSANGNGGTASSLGTSSVANTPFTLTLNVASGYQLSLSSFNYWRRSSQSTNSVTSITVNGTAITSGSVSVPTSGALVGQTNVANAINGLTGTVTVVVNFGGGTGSFFLDDFTLNGNVTATAPAVAPTISGFTVASPGSGTSGYVGNIITLTGTGFTGVSSLKVGGTGGTTVSTYTMVNDTTITFPAINASGQIYVLNSAGNATSTASYTNLGYITTATGNWQTAATWLGGVVPPSAATTNVTIAHNVTGTSGTINVGTLTVNSGVTLTNTSGATININSASTNSGTITNAGTITTAAGIANSGTFNNNGTFQINANGFISGTAPVYGASSTLVYNGVSGYGVNTEWTQASGIIGTTAGYPQNVTLTSSSVNMPAAVARGLAGTLTIGSGSTLSLGSSAGADLNIGGNFVNNGTFNNNSRLVTFNGSGAQSITATGVTTNFASLAYNSTSASQVLTIAENINVTNELRLTQGLVTVSSGKTVTVADGASIVATSGNFNSATSTGTVLFAGTGTTTGTINFYPPVVQTPGASAKGVSYSVDTTLQTSLTMNANSFMTNAPKYASGSTLIYNAGGTYARGIEWGSVGTNFPANGYPHNVTIQNGTNLTIETGLSGILRANGNLVLATGNLNMGATTNALQINGSVSIGTTGASVLALSTSVGGDLFVAGNWTRNTTNGTFTPNDREVVFNGSGQQDLTGATTFDFLKINKSASFVKLGTSSSIIVNKNIDFTSRFIDLGANNITLLNTATVSNAGINGYACATGNGRFVRQGVSNASALFPIGVNLLGKYTPITLTNTTGTSDLGVNLNTVLTGTPYDASKVVTLEWEINSSAAVTTTVTPNWLDSSFNGASFNIANAGEMGNYTTSYATYPATLSPFTTTVEGVALRNGLNSIVVGNQYSIVYPAPVNDNCPGTPLTVNNAPTTGDVAGATLSTTYSNYNGYSNARASDDVWYSFTTTGAGNYTIKVTGSTSFDAVMEIRNACGQNAALTGKDATSTGGVEELIYSAAANTTYYVRVYDYGTSMPSTTTFTIQVLAPPAVLSTNGTTSLIFSNTTPGLTSASQSFNLSGDFLTGFPSNIIVNAPVNYEVSLDNSVFANSINVPYVTETLSSIPVYVRFAPNTTSCGSVIGNITFSGGGVSTPPTVALSASAVVTTPSTNASADITATTFVANWGAVVGATSYEIDVYTKTTSNVENTAAVNWGFATAAPDSQPANVIVSNLSQGNNNGTTALLDNGSASSGYTGATGGNNAGAAARIGTINTAANGSAYFEFTLTPSTGSSVTLNSISFGSRSTSTGPANYTLRSSLDNYASNIATGTLLTTSTWQLRSNTGLTAAGAKDQAVTFRIYGHSGTGSPSVNIANWRIDDLNLGLSVTAPTTVKTYSYQKLNVGNVTYYTVAGLTPNTQYYYVVRAVSGASCTSSDSNEIAVTTNNTVVWASGAWSNTSGPTGTLDAIVRDTYTVGSTAVQNAFSVNNLTVENSGLLTIPANQGITVNGDITTANDKIVIESDGSLVQTKATGINNSNNTIIAKRNATMKTSDYTYWSSPVVGQVLRNTSSSTGGTNPALYDVGGFSAGTPNNRIYQYNEPNDLFYATSDASFIAAKGYAIRGKGSYGSTLTTDEFLFKGLMNSGAVTIGIQKSKNTGTGNSVEHGYNMIGNPYPSHIDFLQFYNLDQGNGSKNSDFINGKAWFWTNVPGAPTTQGGSAYTPNNYAILSLAGGTPATGVDSGATTSPSSAKPNQYIKVAQGFIVEMKGTAPTGTTPNTATLKFDNSIRTNNSTGNFYNAKNNGNEINRYWVKLVSPGNVTNTILLAHMDAATNGYDADYDADLLTVADDSFFSKLDTHKLQIQAKTSFNDQDMIPLGVKYALDGTYKIVLADKEGVFANGQKIYLHDKLSNTYTDLTQGNYTFQGVKGLDETRFEIVYKENLVLDTDSVSKSDFVVYKNGSDYVVRSSKSLGKVEMFDAAGRIIKAFETKHTTLTINMNGVVDGVYIIKAQNSGDVRTKKLIK